MPCRRYVVLSNGPLYIFLIFFYCFYSPSEGEELARAIVSNQWSNHMTWERVLAKICRETYSGWEVDGTRNAVTDLYGAFNVILFEITYVDGHVSERQIRLQQIFQTRNVDFKSLDCHGICNFNHFRPINFYTLANGTAQYVLTDLKIRCTQLIRARWLKNGWQLEFGKKTNKETTLTKALADHGLSCSSWA